MTSKFTIVTLRADMTVFFIASTKKKQPHALPQVFCRCQFLFHKISSKNKEDRAFLVNAVKTKNLSTARGVPKRSPI